MNIAKHTFLIAGAASGLGAATAKAFCTAGANVVLADLNATLGQALACELGPRTRFVSANVASEEDAQRAVDLAGQEFGGLHGLVNCAGVAPGQKVIGSKGPHSLADFVQTITINLVGAFNLIRLAAQSMARNAPEADGERGVIVNTASVAAYEGQIGQAAYAASKAGVIGMTLPIARELAAHGIRVLSIAPGIFETPMVTSMKSELQAALGRSVPFPARLGKASEFAALAIHIVENVMLNGETIRIDGAIRMAAR